MSKSETSIQIGQRMKDERLRLDITKAAIAKALDVSRFTISNWEAGTHSPDALKLRGLADLGFDIVYVVLGRKDISESVEERVATIEAKLRTLQGSQVNMQ